jgi:carboxypeptidase C (cathepsin A)
MLLAGHYVPNLALAIYESNQEGLRPYIDLQGFLAGNAWTDAPIDNQGAAFYWCDDVILMLLLFVQVLSEYALIIAHSANSAFLLACFVRLHFRWTHAINTLDTYEGIVQYCNFSKIGPLYADGAADDMCNEYCNLAMQQMGMSQ